MKTYAKNPAFKSLLKFYWEKNDIRKGSNSNSIRFGEKSMSVKAFAKTLKDSESQLAPYCGRVDHARLLEDIASDFKLKKEDTSAIYEELANQVFIRFKDRLHKEALDKTIGVKGQSVLDIVNYRGTTAIIDVSTNEKIMYDLEAKQVIPLLDYSAFEDWLKKQDKDTRDSFSTNILPAKIEFDPTRSGGEKKIKIRGEEVSCINYHIMPEWREKEIENPVLPELFKEFMEHLFPNQECIDYVYTWAFHMMDTRNIVHLLLHGHRGIGKNTLMNIFAELIGISNYYIVPKHFWETQFNYELKNKRLLFFDEHKIDARRNLSEFKQYSEKRMTYHKKGVTIQSNDVIHASHVIANNLEETNHLVQEARRFSVPILTDIPLKEGMDSEKVEELIRLTTDLDFISNVGWWILKNAPIHKFKREEPYKTSLFYDIVNNALYPWQKWLIDKLKSRESDRYYLDTYAEELSENRRGKVGRARVENFLLSHKDMKGNFYGVVKFDNDSKRRYIEPTDDYMPVDLVEESFNEANLEEW